MSNQTTSPWLKFLHQKICQTCTQGGIGNWLSLRVCTLNTVRDERCIALIPCQGDDQLK